MEFKEGDEVRVVSECGVFPKNREQTVQITEGGKLFIRAKSGWYCSHTEKWELIKSNKTNMNLKEKFVLGLTPEPKKSFRKAEITDGDDILTEEGAKVFLTWLLHEEYSEKFKADVVDGILKDQKKEEEK